MRPKQLALFALILAVCSGLSALVAYRSARRQSASLTGAAHESSSCVDFREAGRHTGETGCVSGHVVKVFASRGGNTFLDFCQDYHDCPFTSVVFSSDRKKFGDLSALAGRRVEIHGAITTYNGHAEIIIREPRQIQQAADQ